ncbi:MAG: ribosome silencing factor [Actinomycetota bacterium]
MTDAAMSDHDGSPDDDPSEALAVRAARIADDKKATDVLVLDVGDVLSIAGYFVVASASNPRLVRTVAEEVEAGLKAEFDRAPVRTEGMREQQWILVDYGDVVVHVFHETQRQFYAIERLYGDVPRVRWQRADERADSLSSGDDDR